MFIYRSRACWQRWHPGNGATADFSREIVVTVCTWRDNTEQLVFEGVAGCGSEATVKARTVGTCTQEGTIDCPYTSFGVVLSTAVQQVHSSIPETQLPPWVRSDGGSSQCISIEPPACADPANPANATCWRGCTSDSECTLVETNICGCDGEGQRVAIRNKQAVRWHVSSAQCALTDGSRCNDCTFGYAGARAACVSGLCTVACGGNDASAGPCSGVPLFGGPCQETSTCGCCKFGHLCSGGYCECSPPQTCLGSGCFDGGLSIRPADAGVPVGSPCSSDAECGSRSCDTGWPGGYCTEFCTTPGAQSTCPQGSICGLHCPGPWAPRCLQRCLAPGGCRNNYYCASESTHAVETCQPRPCDYPQDCQDGAVCKYTNECNEVTCLPP